MQFMYSQILSLRLNDLITLDSKYTKMNEYFGIGGIPDSLYIHPNAASIPIPLFGVWKEAFKYDSDRDSAIKMRDNIK